MRLFRSMTARLFFSHILVASLTGIIVMSILLIVIWVSLRSLSLQDYHSVAITYATLWLLEVPSDQPNEPIIDPADGWTLLVTPEDVVRWSRGETNCRAGMNIADCAPVFVNAQPSERFFDHNGEQWSEIITQLVTGDRIIMQRGPITAEPFLAAAGSLIYGYRDMLILGTLANGLLAIPVALLLAYLIAQPQFRRIFAIARVSRRFAEGDLTARVGDNKMDEVGRLARQFDDMADALAQNIGALRDLAQRNAELAHQAEQAAIQAERARLSRDLHDAIAQRLFSLSVSTATLPDVIAQDQERGIRQARIIAELAEQTQQDLRALLVELRPSNIVQRGFAEALRSLCDEWQTTHRIQVECSLMLNGRRLPSAVEDALYRITQEALSNAVKHADATCVQLALVEGHHQLILSVTDNGTGFDPETVSAEGRFGLMTMRERASSVGGKLTIESEYGHGTTIQAILPVITSIPGK